MSFTGNFPQTYNTTVQSQYSYYKPNVHDKQSYYNTEVNNQASQQTANFITAQRNEYRGGELPKTMVKKPDLQQCTYEQYYESDPYNHPSITQSDSAQQYYEEYSAQDGYQSTPYLGPYGQQYPTDNYNGQHKTQQYPSDKYSGQHKTQQYPTDQYTHQYGTQQYPTDQYIDQHKTQQYPTDQYIYQHKTQQYPSDKYSGQHKTQQYPTDQYIDQHKTQQYPTDQYIDQHKTQLYPTDQYTDQHRTQEYLTDQYTDQHGIQQYSDPKISVHETPSHSTSKSYYAHNYPGTHDSYNTPRETNTSKSDTSSHRGNSFEVQSKAHVQDDQQIRDKFDSSSSKMANQSLCDMDTSEETFGANSSHNYSDYFVKSGPSRNKRNDPYGGILGDEDLPSDDDSDEYDSRSSKVRKSKKSAMKRKRTIFTIQESRLVLIPWYEADTLYPPIKSSSDFEKWYEEIERPFPPNSPLHNLLTYIPMNDVLLREGIEGMGDLKHKYMGSNKFIFTTGHRYNVWADPSDNRYLCFRKYRRINLEKHWESVATCKLVTYRTFCENHGIIRISVRDCFLGQCPYDFTGLRKSLQESLRNVCPPPFQNTIPKKYTNIWVASIQHVDSRVDHSGGAAKVIFFEHLLGRRTEQRMDERFKFYLKYPEMVEDVCKHQPEVFKEAEDFNFRPLKKPPNDRKDLRRGRFKGKRCLTMDVAKI